MHAEFVPLADLLRVGASAAVPDDEKGPAMECGAVSGLGDRDAGVTAVAVLTEPEMSGGVPDDERDAPREELRAVLREARVFRARMLDAFDEATARLLRDLASEVLARELTVAPCDLATVIARVRERAPIVRVRVAPSDAVALGGVPVAPDPSLAEGDAIVELAGGALDARLGVRLASVLDGIA